MGNFADCLYSEFICLSVKSQVTIIYIALFTMQIVKAALHY